MLAHIAKGRYGSTDMKNSPSTSTKNTSDEPSISLLYRTAVPPQKPKGDGTLEIQDVDMEEIRRLAEQAGARTTKREYVKQGYDKQLSLYGVVTNTKTKQSEYRRIEILSNTPYTEAIFVDLNEFFSQVIPPAKYSIWTYDENTNKIKVVGVYD